MLLWRDARPLGDRECGKLLSGGRMDTNGIVQSLFRQSTPTIWLIWIDTTDFNIFKILRCSLDSSSKALSDFTRIDANDVETYDSLVVLQISDDLGVANVVRSSWNVPFQRSEIRVIDFDVVLSENPNRSVFCKSTATIFYRCEDRSGYVDIVHQSLSAIV